MRRRATFLVVAALAAAALPTAQSRQTRPDPAVLREIDAAFRASYSLDHEDAIAHARRAVALAPDSSPAHRTLAAVIWLDLLFLRGGMTVDHYLGNLSSTELHLPTPDPALAAEFTTALAKAIALADARRQQQPTDVDALYDAGAAYGIHATWAASIDGSVGTAFRYARRAYDLQNDVLDRDPSRASAGLIVGTYRYVVATQPVLLRMVAYLAGFGGGREKAIALLEAAARDPYTRIDAKTTLLLIYSREGRHDAAMRLAGELAAAVPRNRLYVLEEGAAAIRAGRAAEAESLLTTGLAFFDQDPRRKLTGERAFWLYKRGLARLNLNHQADAAADMRQALQAGPVYWVEGRIRLALGQLADLAGRRAEALSQYTQARRICDTLDLWCAEEARFYAQQRFSFQAR